LAKRKLRIKGDEILRKVSKPVTSINQSVLTLLEDMKDTLYEAEGVGLAAVQVGSLKRIAIVDIGEGLTEFINPEIQYENGTQQSREGCLSIPDYIAYVNRPQKITVKYYDRNLAEQTLEAEGYMAVAISHEVDHLNGVLFTDKSYDAES
jgi:peptide deformylase